MQTLWFIRGSHLELILIDHLRETVLHWKFKRRSKWLKHWIWKFRTWKPVERCRGPFRCTGRCYKSDYWVRTWALMALETERLIRSLECKRRDRGFIRLEAQNIARISLKRSGKLFKMMFEREDPTRSLLNFNVTNRRGPTRLFRPTARNYSFQLRFQTKCLASCNCRVELWSSLTHRMEERPAIQQLVNWSEANLKKEIKFKKNKSKSEMFVIIIGREARLMGFGDSFGSFGNSTRTVWSSLEALKRRIR